MLFLIADWSLHALDTVLVITERAYRSPGLSVARFNFVQVEVHARLADLEIRQSGTSRNCSCAVHTFPSVTTQLLVPTSDSTQITVLEYPVTVFYNHPVINLEPRVYHLNGR